MWWKNVTCLLLACALISACILPSTALLEETDATTPEATPALDGTTPTSPKLGNTTTSSSPNTTTTFPPSTTTTTTLAANTTTTTLAANTTTTTLAANTTTTTLAANTTTTTLAANTTTTTLAANTTTTTLAANTTTTTLAANTTTTTLAANTTTTTLAANTTTTTPAANTTTTTGSQNSSSEAPGQVETTATSSTIPAVTTDACADYCEDEQTCPDGCECKNGLIMSPEEICAEPCASNINWCPSNRPQCAVGGENGYTCECGANYYPDKDTEGCTMAKVVGGKIKFANEYDSANEDQVKDDVESILTDFYKDVDGFQKAVVIGVTSGSTIATYKLAFSFDTAVNKTLTDELEKAFDNSTDDCTKDTYNSTSGSTTYVLNCTDSKNTITDDAVLCTEYADSLQCENKDDECMYVAGEVGCAICSMDSQCNDPFGVCKHSKSLSANCDCFYGFYGDHCKEPWLFVFTVTTSGLVLILIIVLTTCICMSRKNKGVSKKSQPQDDIDLKNPFVDFQPGVRAKVPNHLYSSISDPLESSSNGRTNGAYSTAYDELNLNKTTTFTEGNTSGNEYF